NSAKAHMGWVAALHRHHDHSARQWGARRPRFDECVICDQCNAADGAAKRKLKLSASFSFSPCEISLFIRATPHGRHVIDFVMAQAVYLTLAACEQKPQQNALKDGGQLTIEPLL